MLSLDSRCHWAARLGSVADDEVEERTESEEKIRANP
jgi:hypothetical protein